MALYKKTTKLHPYKITKTHALQMGDPIHRPRSQKYMDSNSTCGNKIGKYYNLLKEL